MEVVPEQVQLGLRDGHHCLFVEVNGNLNVPHFAALRVVLVLTRTLSGKLPEQLTHSRLIVFRVVSGDSGLPDPY